MINLNLLPTDRKHAVALGDELSRWQPAMVAVATSGLILLGLTLFASAMLGVHHDSIATQLNTGPGGSQRQTDTITQQTAQLNTTISSLSAGLTQPRSWSRDLATVIDLFPADVTVTTLSLSGAGHIHLEGAASLEIGFVNERHIIALRSGRGGRDLG